jgi:hypothetical protein
MAIRATREAERDKDLVTALGSVSLDPRIREVRCPECEAAEGEGCHGARPERNGAPWRRQTCHMLRVMAYCTYNRITSSAALYQALGW